MANNIKRNGGKRVRKGLSEKGKKTIKKALVLLAFALLGLSFLVSIIGPSVDTFVVRDNYTYVMQHGNPTNYEAKDEAYLEYVNTINKYQPDVFIFGGDLIDSSYAQNITQEDIDTIPALKQLREEIAKVEE